MKGKIYFHGTFRKVEKYKLENITDNLLKNYIGKKILISDNGLQFIGELNSVREERMVLTNVVWRNLTNEEISNIRKISIGFFKYTKRKKNRGKNSQIIIL